MHAGMTIIGMANSGNLGRVSAKTKAL